MLSDAELKALLPRITLKDEQPKAQVWLTQKDALAFARAVEAEVRKAFQTDIERWQSAAATAEKWRGLALAKDGDGRTVQRVQDDAAAAEREACAALMESMCAKSRNHLFRSALTIAGSSIRARSAP